MPQFLNRLLALPIDEQNQLFGALETRIEANIEVAIEAGTFERGVETIVADSLSVAQRETVFVHEGSGAETEIVEIARRDRLEPLGADAAIELHAATSRNPPLLIVNAQSKRAALVMDAPSRTREKYGDMVLLHGGGPGYEKIAASWADARGVDQVICRPDWNAHGKAAPFRRNDELLNLLPKGVIAFPGSGITGNLVDKARQLGIPVYSIAA